MRRTADTNQSKDAAVEDGIDVESGPLLGLTSTGALSPPSSIRIRWVSLALTLLLIVSAASVVVYTSNPAVLNTTIRSNSIDLLDDAVLTTAAAPAVPDQTVAATAPSSTSDTAAIAEMTSPSEQSGVRNKRLAYMFYVTSDIYGCAALHFMDNLIHTVHMNTSRIDLVVLHSNSVSKSTLLRLQSLYQARLIPVDHINSYAVGDTWKESLTKLHAFQEWGYDRVVYLDADAVPLQNLDHLFDLPPAPLYAPTAYWLQQPFFASTVLVIEPSNAQFDAILHWARQRGAAAGFDMDILNAYFQNTVQYLPGDYTVLNSDFRATPEAPNKLYETTTELRHHTKLVHFSCKPDGSYGKPWTAESHNLTLVKAKGFDPLFVELFESYWKTEAEKCR